MKADTLDHIEKGYHRFKLYARRMLKALNMSAATALQPLFEATSIIRKGAEHAENSFAFLQSRSKWRKHFSRLDTHKDRLWIVAVMVHLRDALSDSRVLGLLGFTFTLIACASVFYHYIEGWGYIDAAYFSVMTVSTVGYGDFSPQTVAGKIFTIFYVLVGLGVFVTTASALAEVFLSQRHDKTGSS